MLSSRRERDVAPWTNAGTGSSGMRMSRRTTSTYSSRLVPKWWLISPRVMPAASAMLSSETSS